MSPKTFFEGVQDELSDPSAVKAATIRSLMDLFDIKENVVMGAYGNKATDTKAYTDAGIPKNLIYIINEDSVLRRVSDGLLSSYQDHASTVNTIYPHT